MPGKGASRYHVKYEGGNSPKYAPKKRGNSIIRANGARGYRSKPKKAKGY